MHHTCMKIEIRPVSVLKNHRNGSPTRKAQYILSKTTQAQMRWETAAEKEMFLIPTKTRNCISILY